jgi:hypothetical protein
MIKKFKGDGVHPNRHSLDALRLWLMTPRKLCLAEELYGLEDCAPTNTLLQILLPAHLRVDTLSRIRQFIVVRNS